MCLWKKGPFRFFSSPCSSSEVLKEPSLIFSERCYLFFSWWPLVKSRALLTHLTRTSFPTVGQWGHLRTLLFRSSRPPRHVYIVTTRNKNHLILHYMVPITGPPTRQRRMANGYDSKGAFEWLVHVKVESINSTTHSCSDSAKSILRMIKCPRKSKVYQKIESCFFSSFCNKQKLWENATQARKKD